tara:strand:- start:3201 stop:5546 length:2346 start_codon:yes stop_codon:yes gene_type:complete
MGRLIRIQTDFASGAIDPLLRSRIDLKQYYSGLQTAENVVVLPQGGVKRREGLKFIGEIPSAAAPQSGVRLIPFEFSTDDSYMFLVVHQRIYIYRAGALVTNINGTGNDYLAVTSVTSAMLSTLRQAQSADTMILVHEDLPPLKIVRGASHSAWTATALTFTNLPRHAFTAAFSNPATTITPDKSSGNIKVTASGSTWLAAHVGQYINHTASFGRLRIVEYVSATVVKAFAEIPLFDIEAIANGDWQLETGHEDAWSGSRGYPKSITFHEGRLFFGGSKSQPTTFFGSNANDFFNFELGEGLDDQAIIATISAQQLNSIVDIFSGRDLQIFTSGGEFYIPQATNEPITPSNIMVRKATQNGIKPGVPVVALDSGTLFIQRQGKQLNELVFTDAEFSYSTANVSLLSGHLLKSPVDMAIRRASSTEEADRLFIVNSADGSITCYSLLRAQSVIAPSSLSTSGLEGNDAFKAVGVDVDTIYTVVKRQLPLKATATITVTDASNIAAGSTITISENDGTSTTMTATTSDPAGALFFSVGGSLAQNDIADKIAIGHGGSLGINALSGFSAPNPAANVVTVTRAVAGSKNATITSSDPVRLAVTNFATGSTDKYFVEIFDSSVNTDSAVYSASASATGAAAHLENETLDVLVDNNVQAQKTVVSGSITFDRSSVSSYDIGLPFAVNVKTLPVEPNLKSGSIKGFKKRILKVNAEVYETQALSVNGQLVAFRQFGEDVLDVGVTPYTGIKTVGPLLGFVSDGEITVTQSVPLDMTLLSLDYQLSVGQ